MEEGAMCLGIVILNLFDYDRKVPSQTSGGSFLHAKCKRNLPRH